MWTNFTGVESLGTALKLEQSKNNSPSCVYFHVLQTTWHFKKFHLFTLNFLQVPTCVPCVSSWKCREAYSASHPQVKVKVSMGQNTRKMFSQKNSKLELLTSWFSTVGTQATINHSLESFVFFLNFSFFFFLRISHWLAFIIPLCRYMYMLISYYLNEPFSKSKNYLLVANFEFPSLWKSIMPRLM